MASSYNENYLGREQSLIKHIILEKYLERFAVIIGKWCEGIVYVDGFSGPWNVQSENLDDASFSIALRQLRQAREIVRNTFKRDLRIRCIFLEKESEPFSRLKKFADAQKDVEVVALNLDFEQAIPELVRRVRGAGRGYFPFIFIDPTGWTGFAMKTIAPLLRIEPSEVLINFMTGFILRFAEDARHEVGAGFEGLFGDGSFRDQLQGLDGRAREDALVFEYARRIADSGRFSHAPVTVVPHPTKDRTHFHLVYATRSIRGLEVFKEAERHALDMAGKIRADAKRHEREARTNQPELFGGNEAPDTGYTQELASHYSTLARADVHRIIQTKGELDFDEVCSVALRFPTVQVPAVREWISEVASVENLRSNERVAKLGCGHRVKRRDDKGQTKEFTFDS